MFSQFPRFSVGRSVSRSLAAVAALATLALSSLSTAAPVYAQANLAFSGGNGAPLTITLLDPISYTVTTTGDWSSFFTFEGLGAFGLTPREGYYVTGTATYSVNGGPATNLEIAFNPNGLLGSRNDIVFVNSYEALRSPQWDTVILTSGTLTLLADDIGAPPANGSYNTFLVGYDGNPVSTFGVALTPGVDAPEPGTLALLAFGGIGGLGVIGRVARKRKAS
jgi:hypothetical protein